MGHVFESVICSKDFSPNKIIYNEGSDKGDSVRRRIEPQHGAELIDDDRHPLSFCRCHELLHFHLGLELSWLRLARYSQE